MKKALLFRASILCIGFVGAFHIGSAQQHDNVYAAPGMPIRVSRPSGPVTPVHSRKRAIPKKEIEPQLILSPTFKRFWRLPQPDNDAAKANYYRFQGVVIRYPTISLRAGAGGKFYARLTVLPNGEVGAVQIVRREIDESVPSLDEPSPAALTALETEFIQTVKQMRFEPSSIASDTVTVTQNFKFQ